MPELQWPLDHSDRIMWRDHDPLYERLVGCPLCGAAVLDTDQHVAWHEALGA